MKYKLLIFITLMMTIAACKKQPQPQVIEGFAFGTYYRITYVSEKPIDHLQQDVNAILQDVNRVYSLFDTNSVVSRFNRNEMVTMPFEIADLLLKARSVSEMTDGAFDVTAGPLIRQWGFAKEAEGDVSEKALDSIMEFVGYEKLNFGMDDTVKSDFRMQLDFNAIAKGHAVDRIGKLLREKGCQDFIVDIGGELLVCGVKNRDKESASWRVGIQVPTETKEGMVEADYIFETGTSPNTRMAVATSGNYRNYHEHDGHRYSHIINPKTGRSEESDLLSVTVVYWVNMGDESGYYCAYADALATAFMVMGRQKSFEFLNQFKDKNRLGAYFIYDENGKYKTEQTANFPSRVQ